MKIREKVIKKIRENSPLVHNITNYVVMNNTANALLAIGASPVMAHAIEEIEDILTISSSLVINMGTLSEKWIESMIFAAKKANELNKPYVFDPVGVGASKYRTETANRIIESATPNVIRGNASEIMAIAKIASITKGVDSTAQSKDAITAAQKLSKKLNNTIVISGEIDFVITQDTITEIKGGSPLMSAVTGMGCTSTSIIGACIGVESDVHLASCAAMELMSRIGVKAERSSNGTSSFQMNFIDCLYNFYN
jgi:hydroxyethylthiazole kinase